MVVGEHLVDWAMRWEAWQICASLSAPIPAHLTKNDTTQKYGGDNPVEERGCMTSYGQNGCSCSDGQEIRAPRKGATGSFAIHEWSEARQPSAGGYVFAVGERTHAVHRGLI